MPSYHKKEPKPERCTNCNSREVSFQKKEVYDSDGAEDGFISHYVCKECGHKHFHEEWRY